ncbi:hypothetical protein D9M72_455470 [compost metagenome]
MIAVCCCSYEIAFLKNRGLASLLCKHHGVPDPGAAQKMHVRCHAVAQDSGKSAVLVADTSCCLWVDLIGADEIAVLEEDVVPIHPFKPLAAELSAVDDKQRIALLPGAKCRVLELGKDPTEGSDVSFGGHVASGQGGSGEKRQCAKGGSTGRTVGHRRLSLMALVAGMYPLLPKLLDRNSQSGTSPRSPIGRPKCHTAFFGRAGSDLSRLNPPMFTLPSMSAMSRGNTHGSAWSTSLPQFSPASVRLGC